MDLPEATPKWLCRECDEVCFENLKAPNPFDPAETIVGCPNCRSAESLDAACQAPGCRRMSSGGYPGGYGFRYFWACSKHAPQS